MGRCGSIGGRGCCHEGGTCGRSPPSSSITLAISVGFKDDVLGYCDGGGSGFPHDRFHGHAIESVLFLSWWSPCFLMIDAKLDVLVGVSY
jgi:hypothetical protein